MNLELKTTLKRVAGRIRRARLWSGLAACWLIWALLAAGFAALGPQPISLAAELGVLAVLSGLVCVVSAMLSARDPLDVARRIELKHADLNAGLLTAVEGDLTAPPSARRGFLQQAVIDRAIEHGRANDWGAAVVPGRRLAWARLAHGASLLALFAALGLLVFRSPREGGVPAPAAARTAAGSVQVLPGDAEIERGTSLLVVARFNGSVPPEAKLVVDDAPAPSSPRPMTRSLDDPTFAGRVESVDADLAYHVEYGTEKTPTYHVRVFENPELTRTDAKLAYPSYTGLESKVVEDVRHVTAVEGTELSLLFRLNKEVASATLVDEHGAETALATAEGATTPAYQAAFTLAESHRYKVQLVDRDGRKNKLSSEIAVNVTKNRPPNIVMKAPGHDVRVSPVEELRLQAQVDDDFGVVRQGVNLTFAGQEPRDYVVANGDVKQVKKSSLEHMIEFETLQAVPDQLATYFVWAEDVGPDGQRRRVEGDMYFAEVRHFEEIFRQGEQPSSASQEQQQQGAGNAQQAEQLAELQKQIVNGTWKVVRREAGSRPTDKLVEDAGTLKDSQKSAVEQATALGERLQDATSKADLAKAVGAMNEAARLLAESAEKNATESLKPALVAEQAAYQALLKLRAREFEVVRNNSRQQRGSRAGASASQRQLNQLELKDDENRFEEESSARKEELSQKEKEQRETRQVVSRLRELAQRQADLNDRVKELQSALEAAKDEGARKEIERQLKRLREQQQQILRDADELQERMEIEQNRDRMADARQQVEQGREHVRQASEALEEGRLSQALTEGSRAGRKLEEVREDLRKQSSNQFAEELTEMRQQAKQLDEAQDRATEQLEAWKDRAERTLRDSDDRKAIAQGLERQREGLETLVDRVKQTVQEAEETEPLLAKNLFDAARKADAEAIPEAVRETERLAEFGIPEEAVKSSRRAGEGIDHLREGIDHAARSVLGDETAALRRAEGEVKDLADQVDRELAQAAGVDRDPTNRQDGDRRPDDQQGGRGRRPGQQEARGQQPGGRQGQAQQGRQGQEGEQQGRREEQGQQGRQGQGSGRQDQHGGEVQQGQQGGQGRQQGRREEQGRQGQQGDQQGRQGGGRRSAGDRLLDGLAQGPGGPGGPIRGEGFRQWSDRMREVEELLDDPGLRAEAARIRDRVRGAREEFKRHAKEPDWTQLKQMVADPIRELHARIAEEVRRRESPDSLVPIDRDPVPPRFAEGVRRYYERLGSGR